MVLKIKLNGVTLKNKSRYGLIIPMMPHKCALIKMACIKYFRDFIPMRNGNITEKFNAHSPKYVL